MIMRPTPIFTVGQMINTLKKFDKNQKFLIQIHLEDCEFAESQPFYCFNVSESGKQVVMTSEVI